ncbi:MAG: hypothetical protein IPP40_07915 [bacterium]|nr:hypothetical protein [bacterium]
MRLKLLICLFAAIGFAGALFDAHATELYFLPDTSSGAIGDTVDLSAWITSSDTVRGFTIYMVYDTNYVDLAVPPVAGTLLAGRPGLDFRYSDHIIAAPDWLEVGATIFGTSFWAGPGELFRMRMVLQDCGDVTMTADFGLRRPDGSFVLGDFNPPVFSICTAPPMAPDSLTIFWTGTSALLRWKAVTLDTLGNALPQLPLYRIYRSQEMPVALPFVVIDSTVNTIAEDSLAPGSEHLYYIQAVGQ